jgi:tRNA nucleotidyltransferase (CCA-adding enzyme)
VILRKAESLTAENLKRVRDEGFCPSVTSLALDGKELMDMGIRGKEIGLTLARLLDAVTEDPSLNTKEKLTDLIRRKN